MKTEEMIIVLQQLCDANGFELLTESPKDNDKFFVVKKKDIWEGVEFVQEKDTLQIYKVDHFHNKQIFVFRDTEWIWKDNANPSTESAYIEQLKKIAFEKFGEIKYGDSFLKINGYKEQVSGLLKHAGFQYYKNSDTLYFGGVEIYQKGKWAEKLPEMVKFEFDKLDYVLLGDGNNSKFYMNIRFSVSHMYFTDNNKIGQFLSQQLENYLNDTNNNKD